MFFYIEKEQISYADPENIVYFQIKDFEELLDQTFVDHEHIKQDILNAFQSYKKEMELSKKESRKKSYNSFTSSQDFPLITTLLERFKLIDVAEVIENLNKILIKLDKKNIGISIFSFKKLKFSNFSS